MSHTPTLAPARGCLVGVTGGLLGWLILGALWLLLVATASMHTYGDVTTTNAGVYWNVPRTQHWCGFEYRGHPGFFCDVT